MGPIRPLSEIGGVAASGHKAENLFWLLEQGENVPATWVVPAGSEPILDEVAAVFSDDVSYAVRSSADVEDGALLSFAGQFATKLEVLGVPAVHKNIREVQRSVWSESVRSYLVHAGVPDKPIQMGVVVQEMVPPVASGVVFSRNPITGLNEVVLEAIAGRGDRLVGDGTTPDRWIHRWGSWTEAPQAGVLSDEIALHIVSEARRLAEAYERPADIEWVWDGEDVWWVQIRPITGIDNVAIYSNRIAKEVMPGLIKPLVWSVNVPVVNSAWIELFTEAIGPNDLQPDDLARSFAYRAYFNMGAIGDIFEMFGMPRDSLELLLGLPEGEDRPSMKPTGATMRKMPKLLNVALANVRYPKRVPGYLEALERQYDRYASKALMPLSEEELLRDVEELMPLTTATALVNIKVPLLANLYNSRMRKKIARAGFDPEELSVTSVTEMADINPQVALESLGAAARSLNNVERDRILERGVAGAPDQFRNRVIDFLDTFGHFSASANDFSVAQWKESPDAIARLVLDMAPPATNDSVEKWDEIEATLSGRRRRSLRSARRRTANLIQLRESVSSVYTFGYGVFRRYFLELGRRLAQQGVIAERDDIMFLTLDEVRQAVGSGFQEALELATKRKAEIERLMNVDMPETIYGEDFVPALPSDELVGSLAGVPTSRGHYRGRLTVVRGMDDFPKVSHGDVVAVPFSDVGWTPLFAKAGAVIAEAGGMLSHASIVAREYGIPCVVSVNGATRLPDGAVVVVDAYAGTVTVE